MVQRKISQESTAILYEKPDGLMRRSEKKRFDGINENYRKWRCQSNGN
jgi:hypothetical protein